MWVQIDACNYCYKLPYRLHAVRQIFIALTRNFAYLNWNSLFLHPQSSCLISFCLRTKNLFLVKMLQHKFGLSTMYISIHFSDGSSVWVWKRRTVNREILFFFYFVQWPTNAQLIDKLLYWSYMLRHYCVILRELIASTLLSYTIMSMQLLVI